ncbi:MAG: protoporphyrinogen/coproporphyrinogen oxidase, partial [Longimicrobiales bacterium]
AGVGGLALSHSLAVRDVEHVVLDGSSEPGGVIRTIERCGRVLEAGPQRTRLTPGVRGLVDLLGLEGELLLAPPDLPLLIYRAGRLRLAPLSAAQLLRTDLFSFATKLRLLAEPFTPSARPDETIAAYFTRRFGAAAYEDLLGPLFGGLYASDPRDMLVRHALKPALREMGAERSAMLALLGRGFRSRDPAPACSFVHGMRTLTDALYERQRECVRLGTRVDALRRTRNGWEVIAGDAEIAARAVVLTCPAAEAATLLADSSAGAASRLASLEYNALAVVHLLSSCELRGLGYQVSFAEPLCTRGVTFNHALFGRQGVYTAFLGGARNPGLVTEEDDRIATIAVEEFERVTGCASEAIHLARATIPAWNRSWLALDGLRLPPGIHLCANYESRVGIPGRIARARQLAEQL